MVSISHTKHHSNDWPSTFLSLNLCHSVLFINVCENRFYRWSSLCSHHFVHKQQNNSKIKIAITPIRLNKIGYSCNVWNVCVVLWFAKVNSLVIMYIIFIFYYIQIGNDSNYLMIIYTNMLMISTLSSPTVHWLSRHISNEEKFGQERKQFRFHPNFLAWVEQEGISFNPH